MGKTRFKEQIVVLSGENDLWIGFELQGYVFNQWLLFFNTLWFFFLTFFGHWNLPQRISIRTTARKTFMTMLPKTRISCFNCLSSIEKLLFGANLQHRGQMLCIHTCCALSLEYQMCNRTFWFFLIRWWQKKTELSLHQAQMPVKKHLQAEGSKHGLLQPMQSLQGL